MFLTERHQRQLPGEGESEAGSLALKRKNKTQPLRLAAFGRFSLLLLQLGAFGAQLVKPLARI